MKMNAKLCLSCTKLLHEAKYHCPTCYSEDLEVKELSGYGKVYSYTTVHAAPSRFAHLAPYSIILVDLDEGLRVTARYNGVGVFIGQKVKFNELWERAYLFSEAE